MNLNNFSGSKPFVWLTALFCSLGFMLVFARVINHDWSYIFKKDLYQHDESVNSVVSANTTRKLFPAMVRTNPLNPKQGIWMEGPNWQHIPPLFAYVPTLFFKLDGQVSIEVKRLSYALMDLLAALVFILGVTWLVKKPFATIAAAAASVFWILTPFSQRLITGTDFGTSDIVLGFTVTLCFVAAVYYLRGDLGARKSYSPLKLALLGALFSLPILTKNVLGGIPAATFFLFLLFDHRKINSQFFWALLGFLGPLALYFGALFASSPETFRSEIFVSFQHIKNFEGWSRPWHYYITNYLPQDYLYQYWGIYLAGLALGALSLFKKSFDRMSKIVLRISAAWFLANLLAISAITSKAPNFIFQTYLLSLFFITFSIALLLTENQAAQFLQRKLNVYGFVWNFLAVIICLALIIPGGITYAGLIKKVSQTRQASYAYVSEHEQYYSLGEYAQKIGASNSDIFILNATANDCWARYYILFLTGAEAKTFDEIYDTSANAKTVETIKNLYKNLYFVTETRNGFALPGTISQTDSGNFSISKFNTGALPADFLKNLKTSIGKSKIPKIYSANASCSWIEKNSQLK